MKYQQVFVAGGFPYHTYNPRDDLKLEERLSEVKEHLHKLIVVTGQTKSGKTVLVRKVLPAEEAIWINAGASTTEEQVWQTILDQLDLFETKSVTEAAGVSSTVEAEATTEIGIPGAKAEAKAGFSREESREEGKGGTRTVAPIVAAIRGLVKSQRALVIDDFHYLSKEVQAGVVRALKQPIFDGVPVVVIAVPYRRYDAVTVEREMTLRVAQVQIPQWELGELRYIPIRGFGLLGTTLDEESIEHFAQEAIGSPHLMQEFCRAACALEIKRHGEIKGEVKLTKNERADVLRAVADTIGREIFEKLARGPRARSDRKERDLKTGETVDIYQLTLRALANMRPGVDTIQYEDLRGAIRDVSLSDPPQRHEVAQVLGHMSDIASADPAVPPVLEYDENDQKLHIADQSFAFFLRWGNLAL